MTKKQKLIFGMDAVKTDLNTNGMEWFCSRKWLSMLTRCYGKGNKSYNDSYVHDDWLNFQNFAKWCEENYNPETMSEWQLDKDILVKGNKIYSPDTCCFVPQEINNLLIKATSTRGDLPIGVYRHRSSFRPAISRENKQRNLGSFKSVDEAFQVYKKAKENHIKEVADKWKGKINDKVYQAMYNYKVEITD